MLDQKTIARALDSSDGRIRKVGVGNCRANLNLSYDFVDMLRKSCDTNERQAAMFACFNNYTMPVDWVLDGLNDYDFLVKDAAVEALKYRDDVDIEQITKLLHSELWYERNAGVNACVGKTLDLKTVREWAGFSTLCPLPNVFRDAAAAACIDNHNIPYGLVERILCESKSVSAKLMAAKAFQRQEVPVNKIVAMLHSPDEFVQLAGLYAYFSEMSLPYVEVGEKLISTNANIRRVAAMVCDKSRPKVLRTVEPGGQVYKKCAGGVVVIASIPLKAQIRGNKSQGYRANIAVIEDVVGTFCGRPVGISLYDNTVEYHVGDEIHVDNYDFSYEAMSTGFHFFTDFDRAEKF